MDSLWFSVDEDSFSNDLDESSDESSVFFGVFTQSPEEIARRLPRPQTPCSFSNQHFGENFEGSPITTRIFSAPMSAPSISVF